MLQSLVIRNFILIDELVIDFRAGFSVITGETGAGKSILLGAIGLLMGQRTDSGIVRPGADKCIIEAHFDVPGQMVTSILAEEEIEADEESCIIRREISSKGKSRSFINDTPASLALLKRLSEYLIDIHSQHKNLLLADPHFQLSVLDLYGDNGGLLARYSQQYKEYKALEARLKQLREEAEQIAREQDYLQYQYNQLDEAHLEPGELGDLEEEAQMLSHAQDIRSALERAYQAIEDDERGGLSAVASALDSVQNVARYYPEADEFAERLGSVRLELKDLASTFEDRAESVLYDPQRLEAINKRIDQINGLLRKHNVFSVEELIEVREQLDQRLQSISSMAGLIESIEQTLDQVGRETHDLAMALRRHRQSSCREIEQALVQGLRELSMPHVRLQIELRELTELTATGLDVATFLFSANKEIKLEPVADIASGGEISRLMLCIKALIADKRSLPTIIFDEIDTGVSGDIAGRIGSILVHMGRTMQVMAVTHLPQIAAAGIDHFYIYKEHEGETTRSHIRRLNVEERVDEIARMQSGNNLNDITRAAAKELLTQMQRDEYK